MIAPIPTNTGDVRDGMEIAKINQIIEMLNKPATSSHPHLVKVDMNDAGFIFDFSGLVNALATNANIQL